MYVCMYTCMYVCMYLCMHVCMYVCMYVYVCMYIHIYIYMYIHIYTNVPLDGGHADSIITSESSWQRVSHAERVAKKGNLKKKSVPLDSESTQTVLLLLRRAGSKCSMLWRPSALRPSPRQMWAPAKSQTCARHRRLVTHVAE
jgi:hypothetical protein